MLEANRLASYSLREIRTMDEEYIVNVYCAFMSIVQKKVREYSKKHFGNTPITMYFERLRYAMASFSGDRSGGTICFDPEDVFYIMTDECLNELLLHELTHSIYMGHKLEFWQHLQHVLYLEGIIKEEKTFRLEPEGKYYNLY